MNGHDRRVRDRHVDWDQIPDHLEAPQLEQRIREAWEAERLRRDGRAAVLAYAILAALLEVHPTKIRDVIDNYRRPRRRPATRRC
jgi:hypothetical protein